ncbi:hypothetical protein PPSIR1_16135 [Plesiocystis pacifica SIR-1]|uniref:Addiction module protein n=1 Tax=Plesiocystis pacifica SIR-1 TaxID=391625 RepID=A6GAV5_9BACT|nr:addiction module protein [Plesiocystis pacifica]EDM77046.1 hypothetical protein PPSIR1_16135 [Plesiocystis pacifica SIR-1]
MDAAQSAVLSLSPEQRLRLIEQLWDSLVDDRGDSLELSPEIRAELDRRLDAHRANPDETLNWAELQRRIRDA